jgi:hypothetical protein
MLNIKTLIAGSLLSGMAVASFAQAPATPTKAVPATTTAAAPVK